MNNHCKSKLYDSANRSALDAIAEQWRKWRDSPETTEQPQIAPADMPRAAWEERLGSGPWWGKE